MFGSAVVGWGVDDVMFAKPKISLLVGAFAVCCVGLPFVPNSTKPSRFVGITMSFFGILTMPLFCSSRTSIIFFFLLKSIGIVGEMGIKRFGGMFKYRGFCIKEWLMI